MRSEVLSNGVGGFALAGYDLGRQRMRTRILTKSALYGLIVVATSMCMTAVGLEVALRMYHGKLFDFESLTYGRSGYGRTGTSIADYHARLGWVPRAGQFNRTDWSWSVDESGLRSNGRPAPTTGRRILTVGDSFTFGDEVRNHETWPAQLEETLQERVLNAGVFAYGIDQAYLRAESLLSVYEPSVVVLAFISSDIDRTQLSYYHRAWKPYFQYGNGGLELRNVPVPRGNAGSERLPTLNRALGYSFLAWAVLMRTPLKEWYLGPHRLKNHADGARVAVELMTRLDQLVKRTGARFVAVSLATDGRIGGNDKLPGVVQRLRENGVPVLDLAAEMLRMQRERFVPMFKGKGHYSPEMNAWVAGRLAAFLRGEAPPLRARTEMTVARD